MEYIVVTSSDFFYSMGAFAPLDAVSEPTEEQRFTAEDLLTWARSKNPSESYNYRHTGRCAIARFLKETERFERPFVSGSSYGDRSQQFTLPAELDRAVYGKGRKGWTFGALVRRLEALLAVNPCPVGRPVCGPTEMRPRARSMWTQPSTYLSDSGPPEPARILEMT